jgi:hypothetical protein
VLAKVGWRTANGSVSDGCGEFAKQNEDNGVRKKLRKEMWRDQEGDVVVVETVTSLLEVGLHIQLRPTK